MEKESSNGLMEVFMKENFETTCLMVTEHTLGQTEESIQETGKILRCMAKENIIGLTGDDMKVNTQRILKKAMVSFSGLTDRNTKDIGKKVSNMGKVL